MPEYDQVAHLEMIQGVINRMGGNAFAVKTWSVGLVAALFALAGTGGNPSPAFFWVAFGAVVIFTALDCAYLRQERLFRHLFDAVAGGDDLKAPYSMDTAPFKARPNVRWWSVIRSWSVWPLYGTLALAALLVGLALAGCL